MDIFDGRARDSLRERLDYEFWLVEFVTAQWDVLHGRSGVTRVHLVNRQQAARVGVSVTEVLGAGAALNAYNAMAPLLFAASFKILDAIFEWIIFENHLIGDVERVPWRFSEKVKVLESAALRQPNLLKLQPWLYDYTLALYKGLTPFRHEVIHNRGVTVDQNGLRITIASGHDCTQVLDLNEQRIDHLIRYSGQLASALSSETVSIDELAPRLRFYLDSLEDAHGLSPFSQPEPLRVEVELTVPAEDDAYPADLSAVRATVSRIHPGRHLFVDLTVVAEREGEELARWRFDAKSLPDVDVLNISLGDYPEFLVQAARRNQLSKDA